MSVKDGNTVVYPESVDDTQSETSQEKDQISLERQKSTSSWKDPGPPPDGGFRAWAQVLVGHLVIMNTWYDILTQRLHIMTIEITQRC
jgi:hypothetical protein